MSLTRSRSVLALVALIGLTLVGSVVAVDTTETNERPLAEAGLDQSVTQGAAVVLDGTGSRDPDGEIVAYRWTVETPDGSTVAPACSTCARTTIDATQVGEYAITLTVEDDDGATDSDTLYVQVDPADPPSVSLSGPTTATVDDAPVYDADVVPGDLRVSRVRWTVDGRLVATHSPTDVDDLRPSFTTPGRHQVTVTAVDAIGNTDSASLTVRVTDPPASDPPGSSDPDSPTPGTPDTAPTPPTAAFTLERTTVCASDQVLVDPGDSTDTDRNGSPAAEAIEHTVWYVNGTRVATRDGTPRHSLSMTHPGETRVGLVVVDDDDQRDRTTATVEVLANDSEMCGNQRPPVAVASTEIVEDDGERRFLLDASKSYDRDSPTQNGSDVEEYVWKIGDDTTKYTKRVTHSVSSPTDVTLVVSDDDGNTNSTQLTLSPISGSSGSGGDDADSGGVFGPFDIEIVTQQRLFWETGDAKIVQQFELCIGGLQASAWPTSPERIEPSDDPTCGYSVETLKWVPEVERFEIDVDSPGVVERTTQTSGRITYETPSTGNTLHMRKRIEATLTAYVDISSPVFDTSPKKYTDIDTVDLCWTPSNPSDAKVPPDLWEDAKSDCPTDHDLSVPDPLELSIEQRDTGPFEDGETVEHEADVENSGLYAYSNDPTWTPDEKSPTPEESGWTYTWTVTNDRDFTKQREVTASLTADGPKGYRSMAPSYFLNDTSTDKVTVCGQTEKPEDEDCTNDGVDDDESTDDNSKDRICVGFNCDVDDDPGSSNSDGNGDGSHGGGSDCRDDTTRLCITDISMPPPTTSNEMLTSEVVWR